MNYLRAQLEGETAHDISGVSLTTENYEQSIKLSKERYAQNEVNINVHYTRLVDLLAFSSEKSALYKNYDRFEKRLRTLEALGG